MSFSGQVSKEVGQYLPRRRPRGSGVTGDGQALRLQILCRIDCTQYPKPYISREERGPGKPHGNTGDDTGGHVGRGWGYNILASGVTRVATLRSYYTLD